MGRYRLLVKSSAVREIEALPDRDRASVVYRIQGLAEDPRPRGCEKLSARNLYRVRQGRYRILYQVRDEEVVVVVVRVAHRKEVYRR